MKYSRFFVIVFALLFISVNAYSQNFYLKAGAGYSIGIATQEIYDIQIGNTHDIKYGSYYPGGNFQFGVGYNFNKNISVEVAGSYTLGSSHDFGLIYGDTIVSNLWYANTISIIPSIILQAPMEGFTPYARVGVVFGIPTKFFEEKSTIKTGTLKFKETGGIAIGIQSAIGISFKAQDRFSVFAELFGTGMSWSPTQLENTETYSGGTLMPTKTYETTYTSAPGDNKLPKPRYPFSNLGFNAGITYTFGKLK